MSDTLHYELDPRIMALLNDDERSAWSRALLDSHREFQQIRSWQMAQIPKDKSSPINKSVDWNALAQSAYDLAVRLVRELPIDWRRLDNPIFLKSLAADALYGYIIYHHFPHHTRDAFDRLGSLSGNLLRENAAQEDQIKQLQAQLERRPILTIRPEGITITQNGDPLITWVLKDIQADPYLVLSITQAIQIAYEQGSEALAEQLPALMQIPLKPCIVIYDDTTGIEHWRIGLTHSQVGVDPDTDRWIDTPIEAKYYVEELCGRGFAIAQNPANLQRWQRLEEAAA